MNQNPAMDFLRNLLNGYYINVFRKKKEYVTPKNIWFGKSKPINNNLTTSLLPIVKLFAISEIVIPDTDISMAKKSIKKKAYPGGQCFEKVYRSYNYHKANFGSWS